MIAQMMLKKYIYLIFIDKDAQRGGFMKYMFLLFCLLVSNLSYGTEKEEEQTRCAPVTINNYTTANANPEQHFQGSNTSSVVSKQSISWVSTITSNITGSPMERLASYKGSLFSWIGRHKIRFSLGTLVGCYAGVFAWILYKDHYFSSDRRWVSWKQHASLEDLLTAHPKDLSKDLVLEIQRRYIDAHDPTNCIVPITVFIHALDEEIYVMKQYGRVINLLTWLRLEAIFPRIQQRKEWLSAQHKRLLFIKQLFLNWIASQNLAFFNAQTRSFSFRGLPDSYLSSLCYQEYVYWTEDR